jgi:BASS family bile acid:Na+ symporter
MVVLPIALAVIMFGLGLSLRVADFRRVIVFPRAVAVALVCQTVVLPPVCLGIAHAFALPPELAVGLMLLAASPGGPAANLYSHLARGDVALNITLTAVNSLLSLVTLPLILGFALHHFLGSDQSIPLQLSKLISVIALVIMPVAIGMITRARRPGVADRFDRAVRLASMAFLVLVVVAAVFDQRANIVDFVRQVGLAALAFNILSLSIGYFVPRLCHVERRQAIAIGMEIGIHNAVLAIVITVTVLNEPAMSIPPAVYAIISLLTASVMGFIVARQRPQGENWRGLPGRRCVD